MLFLPACQEMGTAVVGRGRSDGAEQRGALTWGVCKVQSARSQRLNGLAQGYSSIQRQGKWTQASSKITLHLEQLFKK